MGGAAAAPLWFESVSGRRARTAAICGSGGRCCRPVGQSGNRGRCSPPVCAAGVTPRGPARSSRSLPQSTDRSCVRAAPAPFGKGLARNPVQRGHGVGCCRWSLQWSVARTTQKRHQRQRHQNRRVYPWGSAPHPWPEAAHNETAVNRHQRPEPNSTSGPHPRRSQALVAGLGPGVLGMPPGGWLVVSVARRLRAT